MKKVIALATSDWHIHNFKAFNKDGSRLIWGLAAAAYIAKKAHEAGVPVLFTGDLFHNPKEVENETIARTLDMYYHFYEKKGVKFYAISGNHDLSEKNSIEHRSPTYLDSFKHFKTFHNIDNCYKQVYPHLYIAGVPYMNNDLDLKKMVKELSSKVHKDSGVLKILMIHTDLPGAVTNSGFEVGETEHISLDLFKRFNLTLAGHIHKKQKLGKNVYMLGNPIHQDVGDVGNKCGYWKVYDDGTMGFKQMISFPQFIRLKKGQTPFNDKDYFIPYLESLVEEDSQEQKFSLNYSRTRLAKEYCRIKHTPRRRVKALIKILNSVE